MVNDIHHERDIVNRLHWAVALTPLVCIVLFYSLILHAWIAVGEWPSRSGLEPGEISELSIPFGFHYVLAFFGIIMASISPVAWISMLTQAHLFPTLRDYCLRFLTFTGCLSLALWLGFQDPGKYLEWFMD